MSTAKSPRTLVGSKRIKRIAHSNVNFGVLACLSVHNQYACEFCDF